METVTIGRGPLAIDDLKRWLRDRGVEPSDTFKVDLQVTGATIHQYDRDDEGHLYISVDGDIAIREPFTVDSRDAGASPVPAPN